LKEIQPIFSDHAQPETLSDVPAFAFKTKIKFETKIRNRNNNETFFITSILSKTISTINFISLFSKNKKTP
jgi:hypothetical protein